MIVVAQPGRMLASFRVLFKSLFPSIPVEQLEDAAVVMQRLTVEQPLLVLLDADLPADAGWRLGDAIRRCCPQHHAVILAHTYQQNDRARAAGIDALLLEGMTAETLAGAMDGF